MKITWSLADSAHLNPSIDIDTIKNIGPLWGGVQTWREWSTDNVVCHDLHRARDLVTRQFHTRCNMYLPASVFQELDRPSGVKLYNGEFHQAVDNPDDIVSMHLAASGSDIVLLVGFDLAGKNLDHDKLAKHKWHNYKHYIKHIILGNPTVQWVLLDQVAEIDKDLEDLPNLLFDKLDNVLTQFS